jgi:hypothetical protein
VELRALLPDPSRGPGFLVDYDQPEAIGRSERIHRLAHLCRRWHVNCANPGTQLGSTAGTGAHFLKKRVSALFRSRATLRLRCGDYGHS